MTPPPKRTNTFQYGTDEWIAEARRLLRPIPIETGIVPDWLLSRLIKRFRVPPEFQNGPDTINYCTNSRNWMNHWGTLKETDGFIFVSEAEDLNQHDLAEILAFASRAGLEVFFSANSYWFPGTSIRIGFSVQ